MLGLVFKFEKSGELVQIFGFGPLLWLLVGCEGADEFEVCVDIDERRIYLHY